MLYAYPNYISFFILSTLIMANWIHKKRIKDKINSLKSKLHDVGTQIELERRESKEEDNVIHHELQNKRDIIGQKIHELETLLSIKNVKNQVGSIGITFKVESNNTRRELTLVHPLEAEPNNGTISVDSPVAKALINGIKGDKVEVKTPIVIINYKIIDVMN